MVREFHLISVAVLATIALVAFFWSPILWLLALVAALYVLGLRDVTQKRKAVLRNFPVIGHFRYLFESIRPEINQYFVESNTDGTPFDRELRSVVYQRAKRELDTVPFGTQRDLYEPGAEWLNHSLAAVPAVAEAPRIRIGAEQCAQPYDASLLNVSAMSYGALSTHAIRALSAGAKRGGFLLNTGEGGVSPHHLEPGADLCWQVGTGYFGCRDAEGRFDPQRFADQAQHPHVRIVELKLSQGAKPGHGGILPARKITPEIAAIRCVSMDHDVVSPPAHSAFATPRGLLELLARMRELSGGKPVGFKLCVGNPPEFLGICKAMLESGLRPDFIVVDGAEGGTGAAPLEFSNSIGTPLTEGLVFVHNALVGFGLRDQVRVIASGKIVTGFHMVQRLAAGADLCNAARSFMFALGCIQARRCNSNHCPVGVATQDPRLVRGLDVDDKTERVHQFHAETVESLLEILGAAGIAHPDDLRPWHVQRRVSETEVRSYAEVYRWLRAGELLEPSPAGPWARWMDAASPDAFQPWHAIPARG